MTTKHTVNGIELLNKHSTTAINKKILKNNNEHKTLKDRKSAHPSTKVPNQSIKTKSLANNRQPLSHGNASTTERQWQVLSHIQRGKWVGTIYIHEQLRLAGFDVTLRTVQRDLVALSKRFLLEKNNANPQGWRWRDDAPLQSMPSMNLAQAVAFSMVEENLAQLLPPAILTELHPWFDLAKKQLTDDNAMQSWLHKVHIDSPTLSLIPPSITVQIKNDIYQAVFQQSQIRAKYTKASSPNHLPKEYVLNPLALVQRGAIIYLLATKTGHNIAEVTQDTTITSQNNKIRMFTLHRFQSVEIIDMPAIIPADFSLDAYIHSGAMGFNEDRFDNLPNQGRNTQITLVFDGLSGQSLIESKLSQDQEIIFNYVDKGTESDKRIKSTDIESITVTATVNLTRQLVWWLRGFGRGLISAKPDRLWQVVKDISIDDE